MIDNNIAGAVATFCECLEHGRFDVPQLVTLYLWDLMWCSVLSTDWTKAVEYCRRLQVNCTWSAPTFFYMEAAFLYMQFEDQMFKSQRQFATTTEGIELIQQINTLTKYILSLHSLPRILYQSPQSHFLPTEKCPPASSATLVAEFHSKSLYAKRWRTLRRRDTLHCPLT